MDRNDITASFNHSWAQSPVIVKIAGKSPPNPLLQLSSAGILVKNSQAIVTAGVTIKAFTELDVTGYFKPGSTEVMALRADYIDTGLNDFPEALITIWNKIEVPTSLPYEAVIGNDDPSIHSASDTTGFWAHSLEFAKIGVAFVYESAV
ncbi:hypothetical protein C0995_008440 [Termitomyces sp. Mi166|nr:hypothetical protein C0995_008440 [Termitomyces sp. Mi166\